MPFNSSNVVKKVYPLIFALIFWGFLIAPILDPGINIKTLEKAFLGHEKLIEVFNNLRLALGDHIFPDVVVGNDGWLFYSGDKSIDDYQRTNAYTDSELADYQNELDAKYNELQQKGIMLVIVIAPNKSTIYPEYMPDQIKVIGSKSRLDQFVDYMHKYGQTPVIDPRAELIEASKTEQVYYKTNTHWNQLGAYIAYVKIMSELSKRYPSLVSHPLSYFDSVQTGLKTQDIPIILGTPNIRENSWYLRPNFEVGTITREVPLSDGRKVRFTRNQTQNLPGVLIYHDSFMVGVVPFLEPHFRQTTSILRTAVPGLWDFKWIDQVQPDIVIIESVERFLNFDHFLASITN